MEKYFTGNDTSAKRPENWEREFDYGVAPRPWTASHDGIVDALGRKIFIPCLSNTFRGFVSGNYDNMNHVVDSVNGGGDSLAQLQSEVVQWANATFPHRTPQQGFLKLFEEVGEVLRDPQERLEWADIFIMLFDVAERYGVTDLATAIRDKMEINRQRQWQGNDMGVMQHTEEPPQTELWVGLPIILRGGPAEGMREIMQSTGSLQTPNFISVVVDGVMFSYQYMCEEYGYPIYEITGVE